MAESKDVDVNNLNSSNQSIVNEGNDSKEENKTDKVMEPLLLEELQPGVMPRSLETLQESLSTMNMPLDRHEYLVLLMHILMLEVGFIPHHCTEFYTDEWWNFHHRRIITALLEIPERWKTSKTSFLLKYILPSFIGNECKLFFTISGDDLLLNCTISNIPEAIFSILLDPSLYIMTSTLNVRNKFQNMRHLSIIVKNSICIPAKHSILVHNGILGLYFDNLPVEVIFDILKYLNPLDLTRLERTCRFFRMIVNDKILWNEIKERCKLDDKTLLHFKRSQYLTQRKIYPPIRKSSYLL